MMTAAVAPMISVSTRSSACSNRLASLIRTAPPQALSRKREPPSPSPKPKPQAPSPNWIPLERLPDAEVNAPPARLRLRAHEQARDWIQLIAEVESNRPNGCLIPQAGADGV